MPTTTDWPVSRVYEPRATSIALRKAVQQFRSPFNGSAQVVGLMAERWVLSITLPERRLATSGALEAWLQRLAGGVEWTRAWHFARPVPLGTLRGSPVLSASVAVGATALPITTTAGATIRAGDMLGVAGQLFQAAADATADGAGAITVATVNHVRAALSSGAAVTWDRPRMQCLVSGTEIPAAYEPGRMLAPAVDLEEVW
jgi:hypothetical protein